MALVALAAAACGSAVSLGTGPSPAKCQPALAGLPASIPAAGAHVSGSVSTTADCSWRVTTDGGWIEIAPMSGLGETSVSFVFARNPDRSPRLATISVNDDTSVSVSQHPAPAPAPPPSPGPPPPSPGPPPPPDQPPPPAPNPPPDPSPGGPVELEGAIANVQGRCPNVSFTIDGTTIRVAKDTDIHKAKCGDLKTGRQILVAGRWAPDGAVLAERIEFEKK
jgi:hypothetical protein